MELGNYDKTLQDGTVVRAPAFTRRVLDGVPVLFQLAEWLGVIAVFQYADIRFHFLAAKIAWIVLGLGLSCYVGTLASNIAWRFFDDPFKNRNGTFFMYVILPLISSAFVFFLLTVLLKQIVSAQS